MRPLQEGDPLPDPHSLFPYKGTSWSPPRKYVQAAGKLPGKCQRRPGEEGNVCPGGASAPAARGATPSSMQFGGDTPKTEDGHKSRGPGPQRRLPGPGPPIRAWYICRGGRGTGSRAPADSCLQEEPAAMQTLGEATELAPTPGGGREATLFIAHKQTKCFALRSQKGKKKKKETKKENISANSR